jgi:hypothetical protein
MEANISPPASAGLWQDEELISLSSTIRSIAERMQIQRPSGDNMGLVQI